MDNLYDLLQEIRKCPGMYLAKPSLERLWAFINGYKSHKSYDPDTDNCLDGFNEYVYEHYHLYTDHDWSRIIQFFNESEEDAFYVFYELFDDFTKKKRDHRK